METIKTYTLKEAEVILKMQDRAIRRLVADKKLKAKKVGKQYIITEQALREFLEMED